MSPKQSSVRHMKVHSGTRNRPNQYSECAMCSHLACDRKSMLRHYEEFHDVSLTPRKLEFENFDEFLSWKSSLQKTEHCSYVTTNGSRKTANKIIRVYRCFRDGFFSSNGKGKRRMKVRGSCKINGICPSTIYSSQDLHSGVVDVHYTVAHVGHETDMYRVNLTKDEKDAIARKIAAKVPYDVILGDLRQCGIDYKIDRASLVTRKDLWNIARSYNLNTDGAIHPNDEISVESLVDQMEGDSNIDRFSEQQSTSPSRPHLKGISSNQCDRLHNKNSDEQKEEIIEEFEKIVNAATCDAHFEIIRKNIRRILPMMEAVTDDLRFKESDSSKKINPCANVSTQKSFRSRNPPLLQRQGKFRELY